MAKDGKLEASVLAFERKLSNSDALMYSGRWEERKDSKQWNPLKIQTKDVRGTISNRLKADKANDPAKLDAEIQKANLQTVDFVALPFDSDTLKVQFSLRVLGDLSTPSACNNPDYQAKLASIIQKYEQEHQFEELAKRYAINIANGRFLWRNRIGAEMLEVRVYTEENSTPTWVFKSDQYDLRTFENVDDSISALSTRIQKGLQGNEFTYLDIKGFAKLGGGQEVFPSQELVMDKNSKKSKTLYQVGEPPIAAMHSQKIGNALRTIDTWYPEANQFGPIAIEPYGSVTNRGTAYRQPKQKCDFYSLLDAWIVKDQVPEAIQQHYVMATLIRGGVFGSKGE